MAWCGSAWFGKVGVPICKYLWPGEVRLGKVGWGKAREQFTSYFFKSNMVWHGAAWLG